MQFIRILLADDFRTWRSSVVSILSRRTDLQVVAEASDGIEAVERAEEFKPDLILLDIAMPRMNGIEAARIIRSLSPESKILFMSQECSAGIAQEAFNAGAQGYVLKTDADSELLPAIGTILEGGQYLSRHLEP